METAKKLAHWRSHLSREYPNLSATDKERIVSWLLGQDFETLNSSQLQIAHKAMEYRFRVLRQYLGLSQGQGYSHLIQRLSRFVACSRDRQQEMIQDVIAELITSDRYIKTQLTSIAKLTKKDSQLYNALMYATIEEYSRRKIRHQPLLVHRMTNYWRRNHRQGLTQVPKGELPLVVSEERLSDDSENSVNLFDIQALNQYQDQNLIEQQALLNLVQQEFSSYLAQTLGSKALQWFNLHVVQGYSQEQISRSLNLPIKDLYRLREKISYHATHVFAVIQPQVGNWLETTPEEHNFGLTSQQWRHFWEKLTPRQRQVLQLLKAGKNVEAIAQSLKIKTNQIVSQCRKLYVAAHALRNKR